MKKILLSMLLIVSSAGILSAQSVKIALLDFKKTGISDAEYSEFSEYLRKELNNKKNAALMGRETMIKYFTDKKFNSIGCVDNDCASESASILKADIILFGMMVKNEKKYSVTIGSYNAKFRDKSFTDKFESESGADLKKKLSLVCDKIAESFPKSDIKTEEKISWDSELNEKEERKYGLKFNIGIDTSYLIMLTPLFYYNNSGYAEYQSNPFLVGVKFQVEFLNLIKAGIIGEFAFPLTPQPVGSSPFLGSGGAIISFTTSVYKKTIIFLVDLAFLGGVYSYSPNSANISFFNISPRLALQYFPVSIFGIELSVGYNYYMSTPKIPDAVSVVLNFIFRI
jgi:hypothetical protein